MVPDTGERDEGDVMLTVGRVASLNTVTVPGSEVHRRPSRSRATAIRLWEPPPVLVVSQETSYGAEVSSAPRLAPSSLNWTPATVREPMIVTPALTAMEPETVDPDAGDVMLTTRLPNCNWARAGDGVIETQQRITDKAAARAILIRILPVTTPPLRYYPATALYEIAVGR